MTTDGIRYYEDHFKMYINMASLWYTPETNMTL